MFSFSGPASSTGVYTGTLKDETGAAVALADLTTLTLTLRTGDTSLGAVVNSRNAQDVKNANNVTFHATSGLLTWSVQVADMPVPSALGTGGSEHHNAVFIATWSSGTKAFRWKVLISVLDL